MSPYSEVALVMLAIIGVLFLGLIWNVLSSIAFQLRTHNKSFSKLEDTLNLAARTLRDTHTTNEKALNDIFEAIHVNTSAARENKTEIAALTASVREVPESIEHLILVYVAELEAAEKRRRARKTPLKEK